MFSDTGDYLAKKARELNLGRGESLALIQKKLDQYYPGQVRAASLNHGALVVMTPSASVAGDVRLRQIELLATLNGLKPAHKIDRLVIKIRAS